MNNLIIAALTFVMLPAITKETFATSAIEVKKEKNAIIFEKVDFSNSIAEVTAITETTTVDVDYIIEENGKAFITYLSADNENAKSDVLKFIENTSYNFNIIPGKIYNMKLTLHK
jgi:hypothetical protein